MHYNYIQLKIQYYRRKLIELIYKFNYYLFNRLIVNLLIII